MYYFCESDAVANLLQLVFMLLRTGTVQVKHLLCIDVALIMFGIFISVAFSQAGLFSLNYVLRFMPVPVLVKQHFLEGVKAGAVFVGFVFALTPVLKTLTRSYAPDTIFALTLCFSGLHLFAFDYLNTATATQ